MIPSLPGHSARDECEPRDVILHKITRFGAEITGEWHESIAEIAFRLFIELNILVAFVFPNPLNNSLFRSIAFFLKKKNNKSSICVNDKGVYIYIKFIYK